SLLAARPPRRRRDRTRSLCDQVNSVIAVVCFDEHKACDWQSGTHEGAICTSKISTFRISHYYCGWTCSVDIAYVSVRSNKTSESSILVAAKTIPSNHS